MIVCLCVCVCVYVCVCCCVCAFVCFPSTAIGVKQSYPTALVCFDGENVLLDGLGAIILDLRIIRASHRIAFDCISFCNRKLAFFCISFSWF